MRTAGRHGPPCAPAPMRDQRDGDGLDSAPTGPRPQRAERSRSAAPASRSGRLAPVAEARGRDDSRRDRAIAIRECGGPSRAARARRINFGFDHRRSAPVDRSPERTLSAQTVRSPYCPRSSRRLARKTEISFQSFAGRAVARRFLCPPEGPFDMHHAGRFLVTAAFTIAIASATVTADPLGDSASQAYLYVQNDMEPDGTGSCNGILLVEYDPTPVDTTGVIRTAVQSGCVAYVRFERDAVPATYTTDASGGERTVEAVAHTDRPSSLHTITRLRASYGPSGAAPIQCTWQLGDHTPPVSNCTPTSGSAPEAKHRNSWLGTTGPTAHDLTAILRSAGSWGCLFDEDTAGSSAARCRLSESSSGGGFPTEVSVQPLTVQRVPVAV